MAEPVTPLPAATIMLLRPAADSPFEVLMLQRDARSSFAPGAYVFPGGRVDETDCAPGMLALCEGVTPEAAFGQMPDADSAAWALGHWVCAMREAFEEAGIFLAYDPDGDLHHISATDEDLLLEVRQRIHATRWNFGELLQVSHLRLAAERLHYVAHWITPEFSPKRFDTRFFVAEAPPDQPARHDGIELVAHEWVAPADALARHEHGEFPMILPTIVSLRHLAGHESIADVMADTSGIPQVNME